MKKAFLILSVVCLSVFFNTAAFAECPEGSSWTASWTDTFNQTTYTLEAPCKVYIDTPFNITATVVDNAYPDNDVGFAWAIVDNGSTIAGGGFNWITTASGQWQTVVERTYTGTPVDHTIEFKFTDLGQGGGGHFWGAKLIGGITVDPPLPSNTPPSVNAGPDIVLASEDLVGFTLAGLASDANSDPLSYRWLGGDRVLQPLLPVDGSGNAPLYFDGLLPLSLGSHTFILEATDGTYTVTDSVTVSIENSAPVVAPFGGGTFQIGEDITLTGTVADYDGDLLTYQWLEGETVLADGIVLSLAGGYPVPLPGHAISGGLMLGVHTLRLQVSDGIHTVFSDVTVVVIDTAAPTLAPTASTTILWPPNGKMVDVVIAANAHDNGNGPVLLGVAVSSSQPAETDHDGNVIPDYSIVSIDQSTGLIALQLRAERLGSQGDRVYTITITAADAYGNSSSTVMTIKAPHDMGRP